MASNSDRDPRTHAIIGAAMEVHRILGPGFLETVYQEALEIELEVRAIPFVAQPKLALAYKDRTLKRCYQPDFICFDEVVVEIKAEKTLTSVDEAQVINTLKCARKRIGLLINFGESSLVWRRFVN
jgi:GxxExxY protein